MVGPIDPARSRPFVLVAVGSMVCPDRQAALLAALRRAVGRHWLDVARYADSSGFEQDDDRPNAWRYRDYVIRAFNDDKPYDVLHIRRYGEDMPEIRNWRWPLG